MPTPNAQLPTPKNSKPLRKFLDWELEVGGWELTLLVPERLVRIDATRASGGDPRRQTGGDGKNDGDRSDGDCVERSDAEQQARDRLAAGERQHDPCKEAGRCQPQHVPHHQPDNVAALGANREPDANLLGAGADRVRHDPEYSDR